MPNRSSARPKIGMVLILVEVWLFIVTIVLARAVVTSDIDILTSSILRTLLEPDQQATLKQIGFLLFFQSLENLIGTCVATMLFFCILFRIAHTRVFGIVGFLLFVSFSAVNSAISWIGSDIATILKDSDTYRLVIFFLVNSLFLLYFIRSERVHRLFSRTDSVS